MELLDQDAYTGPPPRYTAGQTVTYQGQPYTVARVIGRAPLVGWAYELDGPGETLQVGEGELQTEPRDGFLRYVPSASPPARVPGTAFAHMRLSALWPHPTLQALAAAAAEFECAVVTIQALTDQPPAVCRRVAERYALGLDTLIDALKAGYVSITPDGEITHRPGWWVPADPP